MSKHNPQYDEDQNRAAATSSTTQLPGAIASRETAKNFAHGAADCTDRTRRDRWVTCFTGTG